MSEPEVDLLAFVTSTCGGQKKVDGENVSETMDEMVIDQNMGSESESDSEDGIEEIIMSAEDLDEVSFSPQRKVEILRHIFEYKFLPRLVETYNWVVWKHVICWAPYDYENIIIVSDENGEKIEMFKSFLQLWDDLSENKCKHPSVANEITKEFVELGFKCVDELSNGFSCMRSDDTLYTSIVLYEFLTSFSKKSITKIQDDANNAKQVCESSNSISKTNRSNRPQVAKGTRSSKKKENPSSRPKRKAAIRGFTQRKIALIVTRSSPIWKEVESALKDGGWKIYHGKPNLYFPPEAFINSETLRRTLEKRTHFMDSTAQVINYLRTKQKQGKGSRLADDVIQLLEDDLEASMNNPSDNPSKRPRDALDIDEDRVNSSSDDSYSISLTDTTDEENE